jgi:hypothetical protein
MGCPPDVRFPPDSDQTADIADSPKGAMKRLMHRSKNVGDDAFLLAREADQAAEWSGPSNRV